MTVGPGDRADVLLGGRVRRALLDPERRVSPHLSGKAGDRLEASHLAEPGG